MAADVTGPLTATLAGRLVHILHLDPVTGEAYGANGLPHAGLNSLGGAAVAAPAVLDSTNASAYNGQTLNLAAGGTITVADSAWALLSAGVTIQTAQASGGTLAFSGAAVKENSSGTSASSVALSSCSAYALIPSPSGTPKFRLFAGAAL